MLCHKKQQQQPGPEIERMLHNKNTGAELKCYGGGGQLVRGERNPIRAFWSLRKETLTA